MTAEQMRYKPMLASPLTKAIINDYSDWIIEEKYDGHRLLVVVEKMGTSRAKAVSGWTRPRERAGSTGKTLGVKTLPPHLVEAFTRMPIGVYDGELMVHVAGREATSTDVTRRDLQDKLYFVMFDVLEMRGESLTSHAWRLRRSMLQQAWIDAHPSTVAVAQSPLLISATTELTCQEDVTNFVERIWRQGGEGGILKRREAIYHGKRTTDWVKVKKLHTAVLTIVGFEASRGTKIDRGPFATVTLEGSVERPDGKTQWVRTSVKTVDDAQLAKFQEQFDALKRSKRHANLSETALYAQHPAIGRDLRIEFQDFTPDGTGIRHPRWDRWEDE